MNVLWLLRALLSHWRQNRLQAALLLMGLAVSTGLWAGVQAINAQARLSYDQAAQMSVQSGTFQWVARDGGVIQQARFAELVRAGYDVAPLLEGAVNISGVSIQVLGIDPVSGDFGNAEGESGAGGADALLSMIAPPYAGLKGADVPDIEGFHLSQAAHLPARQILIDIGAAQDLLGQQGQLSALLLRSGRAEAAPDGLRLRDMGGTPDAGTLTESFHLNLSAFGFLSFVVGLFIAYACIGLAFEQRRGLMRSLRAMGVPNGVLCAALASELLIAAIVAGAIGSALGLLIATALLPNVSASMGALFDTQIASTLNLPPHWWARGILIALLGAGLAGGQMLWQAAHLPVLELAKPQAWRAASAKSARRMLLAAALLAICAIALFGGGNSLWAGFATIGAVLVAAALALPWVLMRLLRAIRARAKGATAGWFWAEAERQVTPMAFALMALMLAVATNIGVSGMVGSFRAGFLSWLDQRLFADAYIRLVAPDDLRSLTAQLPVGAQMLPIWSLDMPIANVAATLHGFKDHPLYHQNWPMLRAVPDAWSMVAKGEGVLISEQLWRRAGLSLGDQVEIRGKGLKIAGVYPDYGNPVGQAMINVELFTQLVPEAEQLRFAVVAPKGAQSGLMAALRDASPPLAGISDQAGVKAASRAVFEQTFAITALLNVLTLGVAGLALFAGFAALAEQRLKSLGRVWALGLPRRQLIWLEGLRNLALCSLTTLLGVPLGLLLSWLLLERVNVAAFGWRLPMGLFPSDWALVWAFAVIAAGLALLSPLIRVARSAPAQLLKVFAHE